MALISWEMGGMGPSKIRNEGDTNINAPRPDVCVMYICVHGVVVLV